MSTYHSTGPLAAVFVCNPRETHGTDNTAGLEDTIHAREQVGAIGTGVELEIFDETRLACMVSNEDSVRTSRVVAHQEWFQ